MILIDASVWIDHIRQENAYLSTLLEDRHVLTHPFVIGEIALGTFRHREIVLAALGNLPRAIVAGEHEILGFISLHRLWGRGIGYVDAHLLASVRLTPGTSLWTRDKRLHEAAETLTLNAAFPTDSVSG